MPLCLSSGRKPESRLFLSRLLRVARWSLFSCLATGLHALDPRQAVTQYHLVNWRIGGGAPRTEIRGVTQAADGYLWTATPRAVFRSDGRSFVRVQADSGAAVTPNALTPRAAGGVWIAAHEGLFIGERLDVPLRLIRPGPIRQVLESGGALWFSTDQQVFRVPTARPEGDATLVTSTPAFSLQSAGADLWLATPAGVLLARASDSGWAEPVKVAPDIAAALGVGRTGAKIWAGTPAGLVQVAPEMNPVDPLAAAGSVSALLHDRDQALWIGTEAAGLRRVLDGTHQHLTKADGLSGDTITALWEDREGSLWIGTSEGLDQLTETKFPILGESEGSISGSIHNVSPARDGGVWVSSGGAMAWTDGRVSRHYGSDFLGGNSYIKLVYGARDGSVYFVRGDRTLNRLADGQLTQILRASDWIEAIVEDAEGIVLSVGPRLFRLRGSELVPYAFPEPTAPFFDWIHHIVTAPDGALLLCTAGGLFRVQDGRVQKWSDAEGITDSRTYAALGEPDGTLWAAGPTGLHLIRADGVRAILEEGGLPHRRIFALAADDLGFLWMITARGLARARRDDLVAYADGKLGQVPFELFDGPPALKTIDRTDQNYGSARTADGRLWFPSPRGVIMIDPAHPVRSTPAPVIHVERSRMPKWDGEHPGRTPIEFSFAALSFKDPARTTVSYRLTGLDNSWIAAGERRSVEYQMLPPGAYALEVRAVNADGISAIQSLPFQVLPPFFQTTWFYLLSGLGVLLLFGGAYGVKMRRVAVVEGRLRAQNEQLELAVAERTRQLSREQALRVDASRRAGMAEVAANVLHNVGNVLNSANVSASLLATELQRCRIPLVPKLAELLDQQQADLARFLQDDPRGQKVPTYLAALGTDLMESRQKMLSELLTLQNSIEHIKEVVARQQGLTNVCGLTERVRLLEIVADALRIQESEFQQHRIAVQTDFADTALLAIERHKVLQIVINLLQNAVHACRDSGRSERRISVRVDQIEGASRLVVTDNGVGIAPENMTRIFSHGFTTKRDGHGYGLHGSAIAAQEMHGSLTAQSDGHGTGAAFTLLLPQAS